jgi:PTH1 family peptidyl-tRNA hydrolase
MKLIVGLGNPGEKYRDNRHNVGFMVVELMRERTADSNLKFQMNNKFNAEVAQAKEYILVKPQTFMNDSGVAVSKICRFYKVKYEDLYVVHDDLDIPIGKYKIQFGKGPQVHNGLLSVEQELGSDQFWNVRVGVENREIKGNSGIPGVVYSLQNFSPDERKIVEEVKVKIVDDLMRVVSL